MRASAAAPAHERLPRRGHQACVPWPPTNPCSYTFLLTLSPRVAELEGFMQKHAEHVTKLEQVRAAPVWNTGRPSDR